MVRKGRSGESRTAVERRKEEKLRSSSYSGPILDRTDIGSFQEFQIVHSVILDVVTGAPDFPASERVSELASE